MKWTRDISKKVTKLYLTNEEMTEVLKQKILEVAPNYPQKYFESWFKRVHQYVKGIGGTEAGPGTDFMLGLLDTCKELNLDTKLCAKASKTWRKNYKREQAIKEWFIKNNKHHNS